MKGKRWLILAVVIVILAALAFVWLAADPGYVLVRFRGWRIEATAVGAVALLIATWLLISVAWWLLRWPFGALSRRSRRVSYDRLHDGLLALAEGRNVEAHRTMQRAAQFADLRAPALLAAAEAAHRHADTHRALEALDEAAQHAPEAARILRARVLREAGRGEESMQLLTPGADASRLPPAGWHEYALAALACNQPDKAHAALEPLRKADMLGSAAYAELVNEVLGAQLRAAPDAASLRGLWKRASRPQRQLPAVLAAYVRRAVRLGLGEDVAHTIDEAVRRNWDPSLVAVLAEDAPAEQAAERLRIAIRWLDQHPDDDVLLRTLGMLSLRTGDLRGARDYVLRSLAARATAAGWGALGEIQADAGETADATRCYANAWRSAQGQTIQPGVQDAGINADDFAAEERDEHGLPRLPQTPARPRR